MGLAVSTGCSRNRKLREQADKPAMAGVLGQNYALAAFFIEYIRRHASLRDTQQCSHSKAGAPMIVFQVVSAGRLMKRKGSLGNLARKALKMVVLMFFYQLSNAWTTRIRFAFDKRIILNLSLTTS